MGMVESAKDAVKTVRLPSGHMPMLSMPEKFVDVLEGEAGVDLWKAIKEPLYSFF